MNVALKYSRFFAGGWYIYQTNIWPGKHSSDYPSLSLLQFHEICKDWEDKNSKNAAKGVVPTTTRKRGKGRFSERAGPRVDKPMRVCDFLRRERATNINTDPASVYNNVCTRSFCLPKLRSDMPYYWQPWMSIVNRVIVWEIVSVLQSNF